MVTYGLKKVWLIGLVTKLDLDQILVAIVCLGFKFTAGLVDLFVVLLVRDKGEQTDRMDRTDRQNRPDRPHSVRSRSSDFHNFFLGPDRSGPA